MQADPIEDFIVVTVACRWRSLLVRIDIKEMDCFLGVIETFSTLCGHYITVDAYLQAGARCHCQRACGHPQGLGARAPSEPPVVGHRRLCPIRSVVPPAPFLERPIKKTPFRTSSLTCASTRKRSRVGLVRPESCGLRLHFPTLLGVILGPDDEPTPPQVAKNSRAKKTLMKEPKANAKKAARAFQREQKTIARKKASTAKQFDNRLVAKSRRRQLALSEAYPLGYCRRCFCETSAAIPEAVGRGAW